MTVDRAAVFPAKGSCHVHLFVGTQLVAQGLPEAPVPYFGSMALDAFSAGS